MLYTELILLNLGVCLIQFQYQPEKCTFKFHGRPMFPFYTLLKHEKTSGFMKYWPEIGEYSNTACIYLLKVNNRNSGTRCEICSKLTITSFWFLYCSLWTYFTPCSSFSIFNFEHVIADWDRDGNWAVSVMLWANSNKSHILFRMASLLTWRYFFSYD